MAQESSIAAVLLILPPSPLMTREDDSQHKLSGQQRTSTQRICPQMHHKHAQRADDISGVAVGNAGARFGAGAVQPGNWRCAADQHRNAMSSTERGRMILLRSVLDVGWSAARRTGKKSSSEADERHGSGTRAHLPSCMAQTENTRDFSQCASFGLTFALPACAV